MFASKYDTEKMRFIENIHKKEKNSYQHFIWYHSARISVPKEMLWQKVQDMRKWFSFRPYFFFLLIQYVSRIKNSSVSQSHLSCVANYSIFSLILMLSNYCNLAKVGIQIECEKLFITNKNFMLSPTRYMSSLLWFLTQILLCPISDWV